MFIQDFCGNNNNLFRLTYANLEGRCTAVLCNIKKYNKEKNSFNVSVPKLAEGRKQ